MFTHVTHRGTQSIAENFKKVCIDFLQLEGYAIVTPEERAMVNNLLACQKSSHDDLLVDFKPRTSGHMLLNRNGDFSSVEDRPASTVTTPSTSRPTTPAPPHRSTTPITSISPGPSTSQADISRRSSVSPAFRSFEFYPVRREGRGPKKIRDDLDRTFAITSTKAVSILKRKMEEKEARESKRVTRGRGRKTGSKKQTPPPSLHNKTSDESEPEDNPIIQDSDDSGSLELDDYSLCVKVGIIAVCAK